MEADYRVLIIGDSGVGKTRLVDKFFKRSFSDLPSRGAIYDNWHFEEGETLITMQIWDIPGINQVRAFYSRLKQWNDDLKVKAPTALKIIIGNKTDLKDQRKVVQEEAENFAKNINARYYETSAVDCPDPLNSIITEIAKTIFKQTEKEKPISNLEGWGYIQNQNLVFDVKDSKFIYLQEKKYPINDAQLFRIDGKSIINKMTGKVLDVRGSVKKPGTEIIVWEKKKKGITNQQWWFEGNHLKSNLSNTFNKFVADTRSGNVVKGDQIVINNSKNEMSQLFSFVPL